MPSTLDNHLTGVSATAPHPASYRPDLPLLLADHHGTDDRFDEGYDEGFDDGDESGYHRGYVRGERDTTARIHRQTERPSA